MSAFGGKADMARCTAKCPLMTQSGHAIHTDECHFSSEPYLWSDLCRQFQEPLRPVWGSRRELISLEQVADQQQGQKNLAEIGAPNPKEHHF